jgi:DNA primase
MISPETIAQVKERTDLVALVSETVRLTRRGPKFLGLCPFHKEKTPSFNVNPERGFFHCFGCKESGGPIDFVMKMDGLTFPEAVRILAERAGIEIAEQNDPAVREAAAARKAKDDLYAVNALAATYFEHQLWGGPGATPHPLAHHARGELRRRGMRDDDASSATSGWRDAVQAFRIGYAPPGWDGLTSYLRQHGVSAGAGEKVGVLVPQKSGSGHYDRFRHRLVFAVIDVLGRVVAFSARALPELSAEELAGMGMPPPRDGADKPAKYINSPESPIYQKGEQLFGLHQARQSVRQAGRAVLVEGNFDVVSLHAAGVTEVVAPLGTAFTGAQAKLLKRFAPEVVLLFDGDAAGRKATRSARQSCREGGLSARVAILPAGVDPDELVRTQGPEPLRQLIKGGRGMLEYLIEDALALERFQSAALSERISRVKDVARLIAEEDDPELRLMAKRYADGISQKLIVDNRSPSDLHQLEQAMEQAMHRAARPTPLHERAPAPVPHDRARSRPQVTEIMLAIVGALLDWPELLDDPRVESALDYLEGDEALAVAALRQAREGKKGLYTAEFLAQIAAPIHHFAAGRLASPVFETADEARTDLLNNAKKLDGLRGAREKATVVERLRGVSGVAAEENALLRELDRVNKERRGLS